MPKAVKVGALLDIYTALMGGYGDMKLIQRLAAFTYLALTLQPRLWPDEVQFGLASSTTS